MVVTPAAEAPAHLAAPPQDALVLATRPLRPETRLEETSRYGQDVWILTPACLRADRRPLRLDFALIPHAHRDTARLLFYTLLIEDTPPGEEPITVSSVRAYFTCVRHFLTWAHGRGLALSQVTGEDLDRYHGELTGLRLSVSGVLRHRRAVRMLWAYRSRLTDHLRQDPLRRPFWQAWTRANPRRYDENLTDRIPEHVMGPLLSWALRWVDDFADDVFAARAERDAIDTRPPLHPDRLVALQRVVDDYRRRGRPLPATPRRLTSGQPGDEAVPNFSYLARLAGYPRRRLDRIHSRRLIQDAAGELGVDSDSPLHYLLKAQVDGQRWLENISYYDVGQFERLLQVSCWIVIAYLSGMRDSEIKHLRRGCVSAQRDADGRIYRYRLHSLAFKGEGVHGAAATWIVTAPVARAVAVLERFQPADELFLFAHPAKSANHRPQHVAGRVRTSATTITDITALATWINTYCAARGRTDVIPETGGRPPRLTTRQFRRTLAWFIARRPGGTIAGALQYRHQRIQMFEGYAGTSDSGFRDEVEAEEAFTRGQFLTHLSADHDRPPHRPRRGGGRSPARRTRPPHRLRRPGRHRRSPPAPHPHPSRHPPVPRHLHHLRLQPRPRPVPQPRQPRRPTGHRRLPAAGLPQHRPHSRQPPSPRRSPRPAGGNPHRRRPPRPLRPSPP
ncbi:hypothetical protein [Streptomyces sp. NPDC007206]|uniref:hypothetical protein n=1 Tax=Streptomyces sp. NPDC007206 TaxID=3154317 RepID=UPI0033C7C1C6